MNINKTELSVAVLITFYIKDDLDFFSEALLSIELQNKQVKNINIYLFVDGPILPEQKSFLDKNNHRFFKIIFSDENKRLSFGLNTLIDSLENEVYAFRMDADDRCLPERFIRQIDYMEKNKNVFLTGCNSEEINGNGSFIQKRVYPETHEQIVNALPKCMPILHPSFCLRVSMLKADPELRYQGANLAEDLEFLFLAISRGFIVHNIQEHLIQWRISEDFVSRRSYKRMLPEFLVYARGIKQVFGITYLYVYPLARLVFRILPTKVVKAIYESKFRARFLK